jgi:hypothetical protein
MTIEYSDIFVPGGFPKHTYNPRSSRRLEKHLGDARTLCKLVTVTGHTKSGKTVSVRKVFPQEDSIWIDGGTVGTSDDFWAILAAEVGAYQEFAKAQFSGTARTEASEHEAKIDCGIVSVGDRGGSQVSESGDLRSEQRQFLTSKAAALRELRVLDRPLIIDDFHYLPRILQGEIVRALKPLVFDGMPVVLIAIPHRRYDAVKVEREMTGRFQNVAVEPWSESELKFIPEAGFKLLNRIPSTKITTSFAQEAIGSPHLMQDFCRAACETHNVSRTETAFTFQLSAEAIRAVFESVAESIGRPMFEKLAKGPQQRKDRKRRSLRDGREVDIYELVLIALASLRPGLVTIEYQQLRGAIREVASAGLPQLQDVTRVLKKMSEIAVADESSTPVIDYEASEKRLHITDPFFAFYLRWGQV